MSYRWLSEVLRRLGLATFLALLTADTGAATHVEAFGLQTWSQLSEAGVRPRIVVFSSTDCAHCPAVISQLAREAQRSPRSPQLLVVVMDGQGSEAQLLHNAHFRRADRLFAFNGDDLALRYSVNPAWRGLTPYVVLLYPGHPPVFYTGLPAEADRLAFFGRPVRDRALR